MSPQNPIQIPTQGEQIWVSQSNIIEIQTLNNSALLRGKNPGRVFLSGLGKDLTPIISLSADDYKALSLCGHEPYDFSTTPPTWIGSLEFLKSFSAKKCLFKKLKGRPQQELQTLEGDFFKFESFLQDKGFRFTEIPRWEENQRLVKLVSPQNHQECLSQIEDTILRPQIYEAFGFLLPFYDWSFVKSPLPGRTLIFDLILFEVSRSQAQNFGIQLPFFTEGAQLEVPRLLAGNPNLEAFQSLHFDFGESQGWGKVLARPQLRTKPGQVAEFLSGGEMGISRKDLFSNNLEWKTYGLKLKLTPHENIPTGSREITVDLETELSEPDPAASADLAGSFGFRSRKLKSQFDLVVDRRTFLGAMVLSRSGTQTQGPAVLSSLPLIGRLLSKTQTQNSDTELWIGLESHWSEILP